MQKTTIYLPDELYKWLTEEAKRQELKKAEIIRRALDEYRERKEGK